MHVSFIITYLVKRKPQIGVLYFFTVTGPQAARHDSWELTVPNNCRGDHVGRPFGRTRHNFHLFTAGRPLGRPLQLRLAAA